MYKLSKLRLATVVLIDGIHPELKLPYEMCRYEKIRLFVTHFKYIWCIVVAHNVICPKIMG